MTTDKLKIAELKLKVEKLENLLNIYMHDKLTGLLQRRDFDYKFAELFEKGEDFFLTLVDINGLHNINRDPEGGYDAGDDLITRVSHKLTMLCDNVVYRIGGDEFAILSYAEPKLNTDKSYTMAHRSSTEFKSMRQMMKATDGDVLALKTELYKGRKGRRA